MTALALAVLALAGRPSWFRLDRHDVRSTLPARLRASMQPGFLEQMFRQALVPQFLYPAYADSEPWSGRLGDTQSFTRSGVITPSTTPITGSDTSTGTYSLEQWAVTMDQYGLSVDTNMLGSAMQIASQYVQDVKTLGINAGQSINQIARNKLYGAYGGGRTWATAAAGSSTTLAVKDTSGFGFNSVNGVLVAVSGANPLTVSINGVANTVTGVSVASGAGNLTLGSAVSASIGWAVVAGNAPATIRPAGSTAYDLTSSNLATFALFRSAVARLRKMNVPTLVGGNYVAHISTDTELELFADTEFKALYQGRGTDSPYGDLSIGTFGGVDWVRNNEAPTVLGGSSGNVTVQRPIVLGGGALVAAPFEGITSFLSGTGVEDVPNISAVNVAPGVDVALIVKPPTDNLQQNVRTTWSWVGDYGVPTDLLAAANDPALYKRAVVVEHG